MIQYVDIFSGCGGISLGFFKAGLRGLFAIEKNPDAFSTLKHNLVDRKNHFKWPSWLAIGNWDIDRLLEEETEQLIRLRGEVDLVVGGPPCQGFSVAGRRKASDKRNKLVHSYLRFVDLVRPRAIMFENVGGFTFKFPKSRDHKKMAYSDIVLNKLSELGYKDAVGKIINFGDYGVPQNRNRFIVIGTQEGKSMRIFEFLESNTKAYLASKNLQQTNSVSEAISDLESRNGVTTSPDTRNFMAGITSSPQSALQKFLRLSEPDYYVPDSHRFVNHTEQIKQMFTNALENAPRGKLIKGNDRNHYGIKKRSIIVLDPGRLSQTITTIPDDFIHYSEPRVMTVRECARIQSFPDWFEFKGPYTSGGRLRKKQTPRYTQVGNAVPPLFAEQVGIAIKQVLEHG